MTTSIFQFLRTDDVFMPSDMAETPQEYAQLLTQERQARLEGRSPLPYGDKADRNRLMTALVDEGRTLTEVGEAFGVSRERVRQIYNRAKGHAPHRKNHGRVTALPSLRAIRENPAIASWAALGRYLDTGKGEIKQRDWSSLQIALDELGMLRVVERLFRLRTRRIRRQQVIDALHRVAEMTGQNPRMGDFFVGGVGTNVLTIYQVFGSFPKALEAAGFPQNSKGNRVGSPDLYDRDRMSRGLAPSRFKLKNGTET
jgi:hypothetical protein